jgi:murein DD-endopeptidase MepM/ murein hydrolase activator NlpD
MAGPLGQIDTNWPFSSAGLHRRRNSGRHRAELRVLSLPVQPTLKMVGLAAAVALPTVIGAGRIPGALTNSEVTTHRDGGATTAAAAVAPTHVGATAHAITPVQTVVPTQPATAVAAKAATVASSAPISTDGYDFGAHRVQSLAAAKVADQDKLFRQLMAWWSSRPHFVLPDPGVMTQGYGGANGHPGIDLAAAWGTPIQAAADGVVIYSGWEDGYGNMIEIQLADGTCNVYGHMEALVSKVGDHVTAGERIGFEGSTGHSTGPHLHFEVRASANGATTDPVAWLAERGVQVHRET